MKKQKKSLSKSFGPVVLYREDVERIITVLREFGSKVKIESDEYTFDSPNEWLSIPEGETFNLKISCSEPYASINLAHYETSIFISNIGLMGQGAFDEIANILEGRVRWYYRMKIRWYVNIINFILTFFAIKFLPFTEAMVTLSVLVFFPVGVTIWITHTIEIRKHSLIYGKYRVESPGYWKRNKDRIILSVGSLIVGAALTLLVTLLTK